MKHYIILAITILFLVSCSNHAPEAPVPDENSSGEHDIPHIVTTTYPLYSFTINIVKDKADLHTLKTNTSNIDNYSFSEEDISRIANADMIIMNGLGLDDYMVSSYVFMESDAEIVDVNADTELKLGANPYSWLSTKHAIEHVRAIEDIIIQNDPENAQFYTNNVSQYIDRINTLEREFDNDLQLVEPHGYVVFSDYYHYFTNDLGINDFQITILSDYIDDERGILDSNTFLQENTLPNHVLLFHNNETALDQVSNIESESEWFLYEIDPMGIEASAVGYEEMMRKIMRNFVQAFAQSG